MKLFSIVFLFLLFCPIRAWAELIVPESFVSWGAAKQAGCKKVVLNDVQHPNCVVANFEESVLKIAIYDHNGSDEWKLAQNFQITDWYGMAKVDFPKVFGDERRFIGVRFEGNTGSGVIQFIYLLIGWNRDHYEAALFDTVEYRVSGPGESRELNTKVKLQPGAVPRLTLSYRYRYDPEPGESLRKSWRDELKFDPASFSFYDASKETIKIQAADPRVPGQAQISKSRIEFLKSKPNLKRIDIEYLEKTGIMGVL